MKQFYIFQKDFLQNYYNDFTMYYTSIVYPGVVRATDLMTKEDD